MWSVAPAYIIQELAWLISKRFIQKVNEELSEIVKELELDDFIAWTNSGARLIVLSSNWK